MGSEGRTATRVPAEGDRSMGRATRGAWVLALLLLPASAAPAAEWVVGNQAELAWAPASGPVQAYGVWLRRNGRAFGEIPDLWVGEPRVTIYGSAYDQVSVRVAAFGAVGRGPVSAPSDTVVFLPPAPEPIPDPARPYDLDGNGSTELLFRSQEADELLVMHLGADLSLTQATILDLRPGEELVGSGDFDGDRRADLLVRGPAVAGAIPYRIWFMEGSRRREVRALATRTGGSVESLGDFDGDGLCDLLWRHESFAVVTFMDGASVTGQTVISSGFDAPTSLTADLDGDGRTDVFLHDPTTRETRAWLVDGQRITALATLDPAPSTASVLVGGGDVDGDGRDDLLWRRLGGFMRLWFMDGLSARPVATGTFTSTRDAYALGDYDGDGRADDVLLHDVATGESWIGRFDWNGTSSVTVPTLTPIIAVNQGLWRPVGP